MTDPITPFIKPTTSVLKGIIAAFRKKFGKRKANKLVSAVIVELLKENPDLTAAQAHLIAARATGVDPDMDLLRAESMFHAVRGHKRRMSAAARGRVVRFKAAKKRAKKKRRRAKRK